MKRAFNVSMQIGDANEVDGDSTIRGIQWHSGVGPSGALSWSRPGGRGNGKRAECGEGQRTECGADSSAPSRYESHHMSLINEK